MNNNYIGVYDSGIGGLTVVKAIKDSLNKESVVFLADNKNMPYGSKSKEEIIDFSIFNINTLLKHNVKAVVIACNTSDSLAKKTILKKYDLPIIGVIDSASRQAIRLSRNKRIAVMATVATTNSKAYEKTIKKIDEKAKVYSIATPELVPLIEEGCFINDIDTIKKVLSSYLKVIDKARADTIILGCTHYDVLTDIIRKLRPDLAIVSSSRCVVEDLAELLNKEELSADEAKKDIFLSTTLSKRLDDVASLIIEDIRFKAV